jgi:SprT-like protein
MTVTYNIHQLRGYAKQWLKDNYNMELEVPLQLNSRMQRTCGWFRHTRYRDGRDIPNCIELNKFFVENNEPVTVLDVLRHELVHYALFVQKKDYKDGSYGFERELKRLGIVSQKTIDKYMIVSKPKNMHIYECANCGHEYKRQRALPSNKKYSCGVTSCKGALIDKGKRLVTS